MTPLRRQGLLARSQHLLAVGPLFLPTRKRTTGPKRCSWKSSGPTGRSSWSGCGPPSKSRTPSVHFPKTVWAPGFRHPEQPCCRECRTPSGQLLRREPLPGKPNRTRPTPPAVRSRFSPAFLGWPSRYTSCLHVGQSLLTLEGVVLEVRPASMVDKHVQHGALPALLFVQLPPLGARGRLPLVGLCGAGPPVGPVPLPLSLQPKQYGKPKAISFGGCLLRGCPILEGLLFQVFLVAFLLFEKQGDPSVLPYATATSAVWPLAPAATRAVLPLPGATTRADVPVDATLGPTKTP